MRLCPDNNPPLLPCQPPFLHCHFPGLTSVTGSGLWRFSGSMIYLPEVLISKDRKLNLLCLKMQLGCLKTGNFVWFCQLLIVTLKFWLRAQTLPWLLHCGDVAIGLAVSRVLLAQSCSIQDVSSSSGSPVLLNIHFFPALFSHGGLW